MTTKTQRKTERKKAATAATPWGNATVVDEAKVVQRAGDRRFATLVQLLETPEGEPLVRIAYTTDGIVRRGPVTLRARDLERLRDAIRARPTLALATGLGGGDA
ncbi:MAG TPA: hypothetical protein VH063_18485 [Gaiellaceae bacterium]|jgi:hypothetical protein|nr:hypothetical protein [Gaiellaceae bacterium]